MIGLKELAAAMLTTAGLAVMVGWHAMFLEGREKIISLNNSIASDCTYHGGIDGYAAGKVSVLHVPEVGKQGTLHPKDVLSAGSNILSHTGPVRSQENAQGGNQVRRYRAIASLKSSLGVKPLRTGALEIVSVLYTVQRLRQI
jgi:hypothetical protein